MHGIWKKYDQKVYKESSKKNASIDVSLGRLHRIFVNNFAASHLFPLIRQDMFYIPAAQNSQGNIIKIQKDQTQAVTLENSYRRNKWKHGIRTIKEAILQDNLLLGKYGAL